MIPLGGPPQPDPWSLSFSETVFVNNHPQAHVWLQVGTSKVCKRCWKVQRQGSGTCPGKPED